MLSAKQYIIDFYKTHDKNTVLNFFDVKKALKIDNDELLKSMLTPLIKEGFIRVTLNADNLPYTFCLK